MSYEVDGDTAARDIYEVKAMLAFMDAACWPASYYAYLQWWRSSPIPYPWSFKPL